MKCESALPGSSEKQNLVRESEVQYDKGDFISHDELMQRFEEWKKKTP
jgi:hypothetical protein